MDAVRRRERHPKGARYFISIEDHRLRRNSELCAWLQRFPLVIPRSVARLRDRSGEGRARRAKRFGAPFAQAERAGSGPRISRARGRLQLDTARSTLKLSSNELKGLGLHGDAAAKRKIERQDQEQHQADHEAQAADHQLLHDVVEAEEIGEADGQ